MAGIKIILQAYLPIDIRSIGVHRTLVRCKYSDKIKGDHFHSDTGFSKDVRNIKQRGYVMPYVSIRVAGSLSKEQKQSISKGVTEVISKEANKPPESVLIFIDEMDRDNVAKSGNLLSDL